YANFWKSDPRKKLIEELAVVRKLLSSLEQSGSPLFRSPRPYSPDPPDVVADAIMGGVIGFEVTELVDQGSATRKAIGKRVDPPEWSGPELRARVAEIVRDKDLASFDG